MDATLKTTRYIGKCRCGNHVSTLAVNVGRAGQDLGAMFKDRKGECGIYDEFVIRCPCGRVARAKAVVGKFSAKHVCNDRCLSGTSGKCECSCGGKNHGAAFHA